jgi:hypothetical protein
MLNVQICHTNVVLAAFSSYMYIVKAAEMTFVQKIVCLMLMKLTPGFPLQGS